MLDGQLAGSHSAGPAAHDAPACLLALCRLADASSHTAQVRQVASVCSVTYRPAPSARIAPVPQTRIALVHLLHLAGPCCVRRELRVQPTCLPLRWAHRLAGKTLTCTARRALTDLQPVPAVHHYNNLYCFDSINNYDITALPCAHRQETGCVVHHYKKLYYHN